MIRVLICDDQAIVREGLEAMLQAVPTLKIVGLAKHGREALQMVPTLRPNVVLMDLKMPRMDGIKATRLIREQYPAVAILVLTTYASDDWLLDALRAGAAGYLLKDTGRDDLVRAIEGTARGETYLDPHVAGTVLAKAIRPANESSPSATQKHSDYGLTAQERKILTFIAQGKSNPQIGELLYLSPGTVRNYVSRIFGKLNVAHRTQAAVIAVHMGLV